MNDKADFTQGSILKKLVFFMLPEDLVRLQDFLQFLQEVRF